jgi:hypothetical protein
VSPFRECSQTGVLSESVVGSGASMVGDWIRAGNVGWGCGHDYLRRGR